MRLSKRTVSSRANGAKSRGPKTESGKRRSCANSVRHGLLSASIVLENESQEFFDAHAADYDAMFKPANNIELAMVEEMISTQWRLRRLWSIETSLLNRAVRRNTESEPPAAVSTAFSQLAAGPDLQLLDRYESRMHRMYQRSLQNLLLLRELADADAEGGTDENTVLPNEPRSEQPVQNQEPEPPHAPQEETTTIEIVVDPSFPGDLSALAAKREVWMVDTPQNQHSFDTCQRTGHQAGLHDVTRFPTRDPDDRQTNLTGIAAAVSSRHCPSPALSVHGIALTTFLVDALADLGYAITGTSPDGFTAAQYALY